MNSSFISLYQEKTCQIKADRISQIQMGTQTRTDARESCDQDHSNLGTQSHTQAREEPDQDHSYISFNMIPRS